jgi:hypothetical protein
MPAQEQETRPVWDEEREEERRRFGTTSSRPLSEDISIGSLALKAGEREGDDSMDGTMTG